MYFVCIRVRQLFFGLFSIRKRRPLDPYPGRCVLPARLSAEKKLRLKQHQKTELKFKYSKHTINKVFYSVLCVYTREAVFSGVWSHPCESGLEQVCWAIWKVLGADPATGKRMSALFFACSGSKVKVQGTNLKVHYKQGTL